MAAVSFHLPTHNNLDVHAMSHTTSSEPPAPSTTHLDRVLYLFGHPIAHSLSPLFHGTIYRSLGLKYTQYLYESRSLAACLALTRDPKFLGASVTMPHKVAIIPYLDALTPAGQAIGAINTIYWENREGKRVLCGTNTDCIGIREAILRNTKENVVEAMKGKAGMVIGGGGTSRAAVYALKQFLGCSVIYLVNRDKSEVDAVIEECTSKGFGDGLRYISTVTEAEEVEGPKVIVSAIPNFQPQTEEERRTRRVIEILLTKGAEKGPILEMCYHPSPDTEIAAISKKAGWSVIPGVEAMIWQGFEQDRVWLGKDVSELPVEEVRKVIAAKLAN
jgi:quinate dehydrogenase